MPARELPADQDQLSRLLEEDHRELPVEPDQLQRIVEKTEWIIERIYRLIEDKRRYDDEKNKLGDKLYLPRICSLTS